MNPDIFMHKNNQMSSEQNEDKNDISLKFISETNQYKTKRTQKKDDNLNNYEEKSLIDIKNVKKTDEFLDINNTINVPN